MDRQRAEQLLYSVLQPAEDIRRQSETEIKSFLCKDYPAFLALFGEIMLDPQTLPQIRQIASIIMKNSLYSSNKYIQQGYEQNWLRCLPEFRQSLKDALEMNLNIPERVIRLNISAILGSIIRIELSNGLIENQFQRLFYRVSEADYALGVLEATAIACDQLLSETSYDFDSDQLILLQISTYYSSSPNTELVKASLSCLYSSIESYNDILQAADARKEFITRLMSYTSMPAPVLEVALDAINRFVDTYYSILSEELPIIASYVLTLLNSVEGDLLVNLFEFWEILIEFKAEDLIGSCLAALCTRVFSCLTNEDPEDRAWTVHKAASSLLLAISDGLNCNILGEQIAREFISTCLRSAVSEDRAIGAIALGCICNDMNSQFIHTLINLLLGELGNEVSENEALYAIARICARDIGAVVDTLPVIIQKSTTLITNKASKNAIWVIFYILGSLKNNQVSEATKNQVFGIVEYHYTEILTALVNRLHQHTGGSASVRSILIETLSELIVYCPASSKNILNSLIEHFIQRIEDITKRMSQEPPEQILMEEDMLVSYVVLFQVSLSSHGKFDPQTIRDIFLHCLQTPENLAHGEVYIALSQLIPLPEECIQPFIELALKSMQSEQPFIAKSALNFLSDSAVQMENAYAPYLNETIPALIKTISSPTIPLDLKPRIIEVFGDIALAVGTHFEAYMEMATVLFSQISTLDRSSDAEYIDSLNRAILRLFSCIFISLGGNKVLRKYVEHILDLVQKLAYTDGGWCSKEIIELLADLHGAFGGTVLRNTWAQEYLREQSLKGTLDSEKAMRTYRLIK